jgi:iron complex outermembrane recepter protein
MRNHYFLFFELFVLLTLIATHPVLSSSVTKHPSFNLGMVDTSKVISSSGTLSEITVRGFEQERPLLQQSAPIAFLESADLKRFNQQHFVHAVNTLPGVRMEERAPLSYRISIRGSSIRSPFGVRNVKVYWNGMPFTEPNGTTPLNLLDVANFDEIEVLKGPAGSIFGAGTGGVIQLRSLYEGDRQFIDASVGSFGMRRLVFGASQSNARSETDIRMSFQEAEGYRDHSASERKTAQILHHTQLNNKHDLGFIVLFTDINYQIPGGLNAQEFADNPRQARPLSADRGAGVAQQSVYFGAAHDWKVANGWKGKNMLFGNVSRFDNPFILDYKKDESATFGGRWLADKQTSLGQSRLHYTIGAEYSHNFTAALNFGNRNGQADTLRFEDFINVFQSIVFGQLEWSNTSGWSVTGGASLNYTYYSIDRLQDRFLDTSYVFSKVFQPRITPRVAILKQINPQWSSYATISSGFSPPTVLEVRTNEGSINRDLEAERGINYEWGSRWISANKRLYVDASLFYLQLKETITTETNADGVVLFRNAGATQQPGTEWLLRYQWVDRKSKLKNLSTQLAYTGHFFTFVDYKKAGVDFSGNQLTGVTPHYVALTADLVSRKDWYLNTSLHYASSTPLNDANTVFQDPYYLLNLQLGHQHTIRNKWSVRYYLGVDNLLDEVYSLGNDLNAIGGRFFQVAPGRNFYGGLVVKRSS